jgi:hypothetical protein
MEPDPESKQPFLSAEDAFTQAMSLPISDIVRLLLQTLDPTTVQETRAVNSWLTGREPQRPQVLRFALQLASMIANARDKEFCKAWFHGSNPSLDDRVPMIMLRDTPLAEVQRDLLAAARIFASR